jgi:predicted transcriptional regulator
MELALSEVQAIRKRLNITQTELAKISGVSQSLIAKIESEKIDPTYSNAEKIISALKKLSQKEDKKVSEIMNKKIVIIKTDDTIASTITKMKQYGISQLPVLDGDNVAGMISENILLDALFDNTPKDEHISKIMKECPPIINEDSPIQIASSLLKYYPLVIVKTAGKLKGIITKSDIITKMYE